MYSFHRYRSDYPELPKLLLPIMVCQLGNYNLIYGKLGLPAMGATGLGYVGLVLHGGGIWWSFPVGLLSAGLMMMGRFSYLTKKRERHG